MTEKGGTKKSMPSEKVELKRAKTRREMDRVKIDNWSEEMTG